MTQETLKWKLFPFSILGRAKKWYAHSVRDVNGNWDELQDKFCLTFFSLFRITDLRIEVLTFKQKEKETLGAAWARFTSLINSFIVVLARKLLYISTSLQEVHSHINSLVKGNPF
jgi:hypothetical protein